MYYLCTNKGMLMVWDLLLNLHFPILTMQLCEEKLTTIAAHEAGALLAVGNAAGNVYLIESTEALYSFERPDKTDFAAVSRNGTLCLLACYGISIRETFVSRLVLQTPSMSHPLMRLRDAQFSAREKINTAFGSV